MRPEEEPLLPESGDHETDSPELNRRELLRAAMAAGIVGSLPASPEARGAENDSRNPEKLLTQSKEDLTKDGLASIKHMQQKLGELGEPTISSYFRKKLDRYQALLKENYQQTAPESKTEAEYNASLWEAANRLSRLATGSSAMDKKALKRHVTAWALEEEVREALATRGIHIDHVVSAGLRYGEQAPEKLEQTREAMKALAQQKEDYEALVKRATLPLLSHTFPGAFEDYPAAKKVVAQYLNKRYRQLAEQADHWRNLRTEGYFKKPPREFRAIVSPY